VQSISIKELAFIFIELLGLNTPEAEDFARFLIEE